MPIKRGLSRGAWFREPGDAGAQRRLILDKALLPHEREALGSWHWEMWGRDDQLPPTGEWRVWLICAGRGVCRPTKAKAASIISGTVPPISAWSRKSPGQSPGNRAQRITMCGKKACGSRPKNRIAATAP